MRALYFIISLVYLSSSLFSQKNFASINGVTIEAYSPLTGLPLMVAISESKSVSVDKFPLWFSKEFLQSEGNVMALTTSEKDNSGMMHYRFQQHYLGIKIENAMIIVHSNRNIVNSFNGEWFDKATPSNGTALSEKQSLQFALNKVNAQTYKWENEAEEAHMRSVLNDPTFTYKPKGELVILPVTNKKQKTTTFLYAYKFNIYADKPLYRANVYVDAETGAIVKEQNLICTADVPSTANTKLSGVQSITTDSYSGGLYRLRETGRGNGIETYNLNNSMSYSNTDFVNNSTTWSSTGTNQIATDAHWGAEKTYDYFHTTFNRNSIDDGGLKLLNYVHYGTNFTNAFWDGQRMTYGDGDASAGYKEFAALDVCGHEITHGLVQYTAMLSGGESDALNEAFSDIFGTCVEWFARPSHRNWLMGDEVTTNGTPFRNMSNPNALQQPSTYLGNYWDFNDEPHKNNGPCIYWFYLLSAGGSGINDNNQNYNISGISMAKASAIAYRALSVYMTPTTDYNSVRLYTIQAAKDLYGSCSNEAIQTTNAWYAVGVGPQYAGTISPDFSSDKLTDCVVPSTINFINQTNSGSAYTWYFGDGTNSTVNSPAHTYTASGIYSVKLVATACSGGTKDSILKTAYINVNPNNPCVYSMPGLSTTYSSCSGILYDDGGPITNYTNNTNRQITIARAPGDLVSIIFTEFDMETSYDYLYIYSGPTTSGNVIGSYTGNNLPNNGLAITTNTNIVTIVQFSDQYLNGTGFGLKWYCSSQIGVGMEEMSDKTEIALYPNPTTHSITLDHIKGVTRIEITNTLGQLQQSLNVNDLDSVTLPTDQLAPGIYMVKLHANQSIITKKVIKQ